MTPLKNIIEYNVLVCIWKKYKKIENYPMESILSFDKDKDKTKDLFQDIYRSEKNNYNDSVLRMILSKSSISKSERVNVKIRISFRSCVRVASE